MANSNDVSIGLYNKISKTFRENLESDKQAERLLTKIEKGTANYKEAGRYAERVGTALKKSMKTHLSSEALPDGKLYWHIAQNVIDQPMHDMYKIVSDAAFKTQQGLNSAAGMGLRPLRARYNTESVQNIMGMASNAEIYDEISTELEQTMVTFAREVVDMTLKANVDFQGQSGRPPLIMRTAGANCCPWCADLEGTYEYPNVPEDVYHRHDYCMCDTIYIAGNRRSYDDIWTKESFYGERTREYLKTLNL